MSFDWDWIVQSVRANGGITLSLHGWPLVMGDAYDKPTWVVGQAVGPDGATVATRSLGPVEGLSAARVASLHAFYQVRYGQIGRAMGLWVNPEGMVELDLVDTFTSKSYAIRVAKERHERAIFELTENRLLFL